MSTAEDKTEPCHLQLFPTEPAVGEPTEVFSREETWRLGHVEGEKRSVPVPERMRAKAQAALLEDSMRRAPLDKC